MIALTDTNILADHSFRDSLFAALVETSDDAILSLSPEGKIWTFNRAAEEMFEYPRDEIVGKSAFELVPLGHGQELQEKVKRLRRGERIEHFDTLRMKKDGSRFHVSLSISPIKDANGETIGMSWIVRDITKQKQTEVAIRKLCSVVEQTADMVMIADKSGIVEYVNPAFVSITGYCADEIVGKSPRILKSGQHPAAYYQELWSTILNGRPFQATMVNRKKNGELFYTEKTITPLKDESGEITHFVSTDKDITERHLMEQHRKDELTRSNEDLERFASVASHDLQEPLRTISSYLRLIQRREKLGEDSNQYLAFAVDAANRLHDLIRSLLSYSKVGAERVKITEFAAEDALTEALKNLEDSIKRAHAQINFGALPRIRGDFHRTVQLFQNIVGNAIKYRSDHPPTVKISAARSSNGWVFQVGDNGIGIPPESRRRIFEMFQRLRGRQRFEGTGIGLAICRRIVEQRGGEIWVESIPGMGSKFYFTIPDRLPTEADA